MRATSRSFTFAGLAAAVALALPSPASAAADIVRVETEDRVVINAVHYRPDRPSKSVVVLVPGLDGGVLFTGHDYGPLASALNAAGYALLIPNMRTAALNFAYSVFDTANEDLRGVIAFAKRSGYEQIALFGTSLGGPRVAWYLSKNEEPAIRAVGFLAATTSPGLSDRTRNLTNPEAATHFQDVLARSRALVADGRPNELITYNFTLGRVLPMSARTFISYWGDPERESNASTLKWIGTAVKVPALVIHGSADTVVPASQAEVNFKALTSAPKKDLVIVEGASHYLSVGWIAEAYATRITSWLVANFPAR